MLTRIKYKLFLTLLLSSVLTASGFYLFNQWNFDRGFLNYVHKQRIIQLEQFSRRLTTYYTRTGTWAALRGNAREWRQLMAEGAVQLPRNNAPGFRPGPHGSPPHAPPPEFGPRLTLFDADRNRVAGLPSRGESKQQHRQYMLPLKIGDEVVGYLSMIPPKEITEAGDLLFVEQQTKSFALVTLLMVVLSMVVSFVMTSHLLRPINAIATGTRKLIAGHFKTQIQVSTRDELGQLAGDFNSLALALHKSEQDRRQWLSDISHELRTPLSILQGEIEALQDGIRQPTAEVLEALHSEIMHLGRLIDDLRELEKSDVGALTYKMMQVNLIGILRNSVDVFAHRYASKGLELSVDLPDAPLSMIGDPDRLQQLLCNLLENSLRYTDAPGKLYICVQHSENTLGIDFQDTAPGVAEALQPKLFERLFRVDPSRSRTSGGAGLGMTICKNIVEAHQGRITAATAPQGGLWIRIELPLRV